MENVRVGQAVFFMASCKAFNGGIADRNSLMPVILDPISGKSPRGLNVISGTSAEMNGFEVGKCYGVKAVETEVYVDKDGKSVRSFNFSVIGELSVQDAMKEAMNSSPTFLIQPNSSTEESTEDVAEKIEATA